MLPADAGQLTQLLLQMTQVIDRPVFVKVGANDGVTGDPCGDLFLRHTNWTGLLIEPVPYLAQKLRQIYSDPNRFIIEQIAVGTQPGIAQFYYVSEDAKRTLPHLPIWYDQLGSFNRQHILNHVQSLEPFIISMDVQVEPLQSIVQRQCLTKIEFLHIDTEGHDLKVLQSVDLGSLAPLAVWVEYKHLSLKDQLEMQTLLETHGYDVRQAHDDFFAVHREAQEMMRQRQSPA